MSKRTKKDKRPVAKIDFKPYGAAIKAGRTKQKESRNKAADAVNAILADTGKPLHGVVPILRQGQHKR